MYFNKDNFPKPYEWPKSRVWNRLEGRPRVQNIPDKNLDYSQSLKTEIYDALWMLTRQWQFGELHGDDAGTAIKAVIKIKSLAVNGFTSKNSSSVQAYNANIFPGEVFVEAEPPIFDLKAIIQISAFFRKCLIKEGLGNQIYLDIVSQISFDNLDRFLGVDKQENLEPKLMILFRSLNGKLLDAENFIEKTNDPQSILKNISVSTVERNSVFKAILNFKSWYKNSIYYSNRPSNWSTDRLEYQFSQRITADNEIRILNSQQYYQGDLDWYNSDFKKLGNGGGSGSGNEILKEVIPVPIQFNGMPNSRWWAFENGRINFGKVKVGLSDIATLQLMEFGLLYSNDWHVVPLTLPLGTGNIISELEITDVFGEKTILDSLNQNDSTLEWNDWATFAMTRIKEGQEILENNYQPNFLYLPATIQGLQKGSPIEIVRFIRDEWNNLIWAIEDKIPGGWGEGIGPLTSNIDSSVTAETDSYDYSYSLISKIPENWFAFIPKVEDSNGQIYFTRSNIIRDLSGRDVNIPKGKLLNEAKPYKLNEEEIPIKGIQVLRYFQRTRWKNGKVFTWIGRRKKLNFNPLKEYVDVDQIK